MKAILRNQIPDFLDFKDFCEWYLLAGPFFSPRDPVLKSIQIAPNSTETIVFQHKRYQVELYFVDFTIPLHQHLKVATMEYLLRPLEVPDLNTLKILPAGGSHGGLVPHNGEPFFQLILQEWPLGMTQDFISLTDYIGAPISQNHLDLVASKNPAWVTADNQINTSK